MTEAPFELIAQKALLTVNDSLKLPHCCPTSALPKDCILPHACMECRLLLHTGTFLHSSPQLPVCFILRQLYIPRCAESVIRRAFGVSLPVSACGRLPDSGSALPDSLHHSIPAMAGSAKSQGDHGIHTGVVFNGQVTANILQVSMVGGNGIA